MTVIEALVALQEVDGRIRECDRILKDLPHRRANEVARLQGVDTDLRSAKENQEQVNRRVRGYEEEAKALKDRILQLKQTQVGLKSNREYQQYSVQIDLISNDLNAAENNQLAALDNLPGADARIQEAQEKYAAEKREVDLFCEELDKRIAAVKAQLAEAEAERVERLRDVPDPKARLYYERLLQKRWPVVVQLTDDKVCDGCHLVQPDSVEQMVKANETNALRDSSHPQRIVVCTMCGRILYR